MILFYLISLFGILPFCTCQNAHLAIHHTSIVTHNISASMEFYQYGIGLDLLSDVTVEMDWQTLLGAKTNSLRAVSLGNSQIPDTTAGVVELNAFEGGVPIGPIDSADQPESGLFLISFFVDVNATLARLQSMGYGLDFRMITSNTSAGQSTLATVRDPDGVIVLLTPGSIINSQRSLPADKLL
ncbi:hypothetical protein HDV63DRAFT_412220 [Trichoderma sp. SZMC 28014]